MMPGKQFGRGFPSDEIIKGRFSPVAGLLPARTPETRSKNTSNLRSKLGRENRRGPTILEARACGASGCPASGYGEFPMKY